PPPQLHVVAGAARPADLCRGESRPQLPRRPRIALDDGGESLEMFRTEAGIRCSFATPGHDARHDRCDGKLPGCRGEPLTLEQLPGPRPGRVEVVEGEEELGGVEGETGRDLVLE